MERHLKDSTLILLLGLMTALTALSTDIYLPSMPQMANIFHTSSTAIQFTLSIYFIGFSCAQLFFGSLSDRFGRRPVLMVGLLIYLFASIACALAPTIAVLIIARFLQAVGACSGSVTAFAIVRDKFTREKSVKVLGYISTTVALSPALAPILGGYIDVWFNWRGCFIVLAIFAFILIPICSYCLPETNHKLDATATQFKRMLSIYGRILTHREFLLSTTINTMAFAALFAFISVSPVLLIKLAGIATENFGYFFAINALTFMASALATANLANKLRIGTIITLGGSLIIIGGVLMAYLAIYTHMSGITIVGPMLLATCGLAMAMPTSTTLSLAPFAQNAGAASAMLGFVRFAMAAAVGSFTSMLITRNQLPLAIILIACGIISVLGMVLLQGLQARDQADESVV